MENYKKYLVLKLTNGGLNYESLNVKVDGKNPIIKKIAEEEGVNISNIKRGDNLSTPIPYTLLSNMLTSLMGGIPIPTKPSRRSKMLYNLERPAICDEMAKSAYYKIDSFIDDSKYVKQIVGEDGEYYSIVDGTPQGMEFFQSAKPAIDSNRTVSTTFKFDDGTEKQLPSIFNFAMLNRGFDYNCDAVGYRKLIDTINDILGVEDVLKTYTFPEMVNALYMKSGNEEYQAKVKALYDDLGTNDEWAPGRIDAWFYCIFNYGNGKVSSIHNVGKSDSDFSKMTKTYLRNRIGNSISKFNVDGYVIVEVTDERVERAIRENSGVCSFLDNGKCEVVAFENYEPFTNYKEEWKKIYEEKSM